MVPGIPKEAAFLIHVTFLESGRGVLAEIGEKDGGKVVVKSGRFGAYISWKKVNAKIPTEYLEEPSSLPLEEAWSLVQDKAESMGLKVGAKSKKVKNQTSSVELPPGPKRPLSAYFHFCATKRTEVSERVSSLGETSKELSRLWSETSDEDRRPYVDLAETAKREYEEKKEEWTKICQEVLKKADASSKSRSIKEISVAKDTIKRPRSSYVFFCTSKRADVSMKYNRLGDISKELARLWSEVTPEERNIYDNMARDDKERYEREKGAIQVTGVPAEPKTKMVVVKKRGLSAYMLFCAAHRNSIVDENGKKLPLGETTKQLAKMWNECDEATRKAYVIEAEKEKERVA